MDRREFLQLGAFGGAAALTACGPAGAPADPGATPFTPEFELSEISLDDLRVGLSRGDWSSQELVELYLARIDEVDARGPALHSVIEVNPEALEIARMLDRERAGGRTRGSLHGVPVMLKDNLDTADRMRTSAGSLALAEHVARRDAYLVHQLRRAGAVILGKTNLSEWANFRSSRSSSGWSGRGGQTLNPHALDRNPCGSSSGSAAAVAASLCAAAIGTETDGSIVCPSSACGIVGIKPTVGLVSRSGVIPISHSQDTPGPMARTVRDAAILLGVIAGADPRDPATAAAAVDGRALTDYTAALDPGGLRGARIGVARNYFGFHERVDALMQEAIAALREGGAEIVDPANVDPPESFGDDEFEMLLYEFKHDLNGYLAGTDPSLPARTLEGLIRFNLDNAESEMPWFGQELFEQAQERGPLTEDRYVQALERGPRLARAEGIDAIMRAHRLDALVAPTGGPAWPIDLVNGDHFGGGSSSAAAVAGYPNVTVPAGVVHGLPVGISFIGAAWSEPTLLRLAYAFEQATKLRRRPTFRQSITSV